MGLVARGLGVRVSEVQISSFGFQVLGFRFRVSDFRFMILGFRFQVSGFGKYRALGRPAGTGMLGAVPDNPARGTSLIRNSSPTQDHHRALGIVLL